jgi:hypothetical protein
MNRQVRQCTYKCDIEVRSRNRSCCGKTIDITQSESVLGVAVIQHAERMHCIIIVVCGLFGSTISLFPRLSSNRADFQKNCV